MFHKLVRFSASLLLAMSFSFSGFQAATAGEPLNDDFTPAADLTSPSIERSLEVAAPPIADFTFAPTDPSIYDTVQFTDASYDPEVLGFKSAAWDFGDGSTSADPNPAHQYLADGDYTVHLLRTTYDDRTASTTQVVSVRTHDIFISKITSPKVAMSTQWWRIHVDVRSLRYEDTVQVALYKSVSGGYQHIGTCTRQVPENSGNHTTRFTFTYIFNLGDSALGQIHFKAVATITNARDAIPANNEAISAPPTQVKK